MKLHNHLNYHNNNNKNHHNNYHSLQHSSSSNHHHHYYDGGVDGRCCRLRSWCSRETRQAVMQLVLLCLASCSWTLLLISLTLTSSSTKHSKHVIEVAEEPGPEWRGGSTGACEECLTRRGPPGTYWRVFQKPLQQVVDALDRLDQPLATPALRTQLLGARALLRHLATVLHFPLATVSGSSEPVAKESEAVLLLAPGKPHERLACQERFLGSKVGYPRYHEGYIRVNCTAAPLNHALTAVLWDISPEHLQKIQQDFQRVYPELSLLLVAAPTTTALPNVVVHPPNPSLSHALAHVLTQVKTPYVLLAPQLTQLSYHSRLERLLWVAEWAGVWAVSGSVRGSDGRWRAGCLQMREGEGQLVYSRGYQASMYECQLCHGVEGPVVMRTAALASIAWPSPSTHPNLLLPHLLLQVHAGAEPHQRGAATCPDAMFLVNSLEPPWQQKPTQPLLQERELRRVASLWRPLAHRRKISRIHLPPALTINFPCDFLPTARPSITTRTFPTAAESNTTAARACEGQELKTVLSAIMQACQALETRCFLLEPTMQGVVFGDLFDLPIKNLTLGVTSADLLARLLPLVKLSSYAIDKAGEQARVEGRWWTVIVKPHVPDQHTKWSRLEVVSGVWVWSWLPSVEARGKDWLLPHPQVPDVTLAEDMRVLGAPRCAQGRSSHLTLRSP